jgi:hypothetical protein
MTHVDAATEPRPRRKRPKKLPRHAYDRRRRLGRRVIALAEAFRQRIGPAEVAADPRMRTGRPRHGSTGTQLAASSAARKPPLPRDLRLRRRSPLLGSGCAGPSIIRSLHDFRLARAKGAISRMPRTNVQGPRPGDWKRQVTTKGPARAWRAMTGRSGQYCRRG